MQQKQSPQQHQGAAAAAAAGAAQRPVATIVELELELCIPWATVAAQVCNAVAIFVIIN